MVHFCNGTNTKAYVSLTTPPSSEHNTLDKPEEKKSHYERIVNKTGFKGDLFVVKIVVIVLILAIIWLIYNSYAQQKEINFIKLSMIAAKDALTQDEDVKYRCDLSVGRGISSSKMEINYLKGNDCIIACSHMKRKDNNINGAIVFSDNRRRGCWCARNMTSIVGKYKTCFLKPNTSQSIKDQRHGSSLTTTAPTTTQNTNPNICQFKPGDGVGGSEFKMGNLKGDSCVDTCLHLKEIDSTINGVTIYSNTSKGGCWCKQGMRGMRPSRLFKTCQLSSLQRKTNPGENETYVCDFSAGNGAGGSEIKVGYQKDDSCIDACIHMKKLDPSINGVTMYTNPSHKGCWCEKDMRIVDGIFKTCFLNSM